MTRLCLAGSSLLDSAPFGGLLASYLMSSRSAGPSDHFQDHRLKYSASAEKRIGLRRVTRSTLIEELVHVPGVVGHMVKHNLPCLVCGEPAWGTFEDVARARGKSEEEIEVILAGLNDLLKGGEK